MLDGFIFLSVALCAAISSAAVAVIESNRKAKIREEERRKELERIQKEKAKQKELEKQAVRDMVEKRNKENFERQIRETKDILENTTDWNTFMSRYEFLKTTYSRLLALGKSNPRIGIDFLLVESERDKFFNAKQQHIEIFIMNLFDKTKAKVQSLKTVKAKLNNIEKFEIEIKCFAENFEISEENLILTTELARQLREKYT